MEPNKIQILSTKKLSSSIIEDAKQRGVAIVEKEFISIQPIPIIKEKHEQVMAMISNKEISNVVFTSANAVEAIKNYLHHGDTRQDPNWNIFCLSGKTKNSLSPLFNPGRILAIAENASSLVQEILKYDLKEIIFFCGNKRRDEIPLRMKHAGINVHEIIVYETIETPHVSEKDWNGILFFSPSAVKSFFSINRINTKTICFAIGETTASAIKEYSDNKIITSESPTQEKILAAVNLYFKNIKVYK